MAEPWLELALTLQVGPRPLRAELRAEGATVGIAGPSGSGKTTLLRVLAGLDRRAGGAVRAFGELWQGPGVFVAPWARRAAWVPQEAALFPHLSVRENLVYGGGEGSEAVAALLGVEGLLDRAPRNLSGGERQRVALGRAMLSRPRLLLLDEPFAALDRPLRARLAADLAGWCGRRGVRVVLVTHDERDLEPFEADRWSVDPGGLRRAGP